MSSNKKPDWFKGKWRKKGGSVKSYKDGKDYKLSSSQLSVFDEMSSLWILIQMSEKENNDALINLKEVFNQCVLWWVLNDQVLMKKLFTWEQLNVDKDIQPTLPNANDINYFDRILSVRQEGGLRTDDIIKNKIEDTADYSFNDDDIIEDLGFKELKLTLSELKKCSTESIYNQCKAVSERNNDSMQGLNFSAYCNLMGLDFEGEQMYSKFLKNYAFYDIESIALNYRKARDIAKFNNCRMLMIFCNWKYKVAEYCAAKSHPPSYMSVSFTHNPKIETNYKIKYYGNTRKVNIILGVLLFIVILLILLKNIL